MHITGDNAANSIVFGFLCSYLFAVATIACRWPPLDFCLLKYMPSPVLTLFTELAHSLNTCPTLFFCLGTLLERSLPPEILLFGTRLHHLQKLLADVNFSVNPLPSSPIRIVCAPRLMPGIYYSTSRRNQTEYWTRKSIANYGLLTCLCKGNYFPSESVAQG